MTHFTALVALPAELSTSPELSSALEAALAPFDETLSVPRYVSMTRAELIARARSSVELLRPQYEEFLADPSAYARRYEHNPAHLAYLRGDTEDGGHPARLEWSDEQFYTDAIRYYEPGEIACDGGVYSTANAQGVWDWWVIGGRWGGYLTLTAPDEDSDRLATEGSAFGLAEEASLPGRVDCARLRELNRAEITIPYGYVCLHGQWRAMGTVGWFGTSADDCTGEEWSAAVRRWLDGLDDGTWLVAVDMHS